MSSLPRKVRARWVRVVGIGKLLEARAHPHEFASREERMHRFAFGDEREFAIDVR